MPVSPFEAYLLDFFHKRATSEASKDLFECHFKTFEALARERQDGFQRIFVFDPAGPVDAYNKPAFSTFIQWVTQPMEQVKPREPTNVGKPLKRFTCFSKLIPELRAEIWKHALPESQIVELYRTRDAVFNYQMPLAARKALGSLLLTCSETYEFVKIHYSAISFGANFGAPRILMDPKSDVLYFSGADQIVLQMRTAGLHNQVAQFSTLAVPAHILKFFLLTSNTGEFSHWLSGFHSLKTLFLITTDDHQQRGSGLDLVPYTGPSCSYKIDLSQAWDVVTQELGLSIQLVWMDPYRDGVRVCHINHCH
jgi:hypothetical protein